MLKEGWSRAVLGKTVQSSFGEEWCREKCCGKMKSRSVGEEWRREVLGKGGVEQFWGKVM